MHSRPDPAFVAPQADPVEKVLNLFHDSIAVRASSGEALAPKLVQAAALLGEAFVRDSRVLTCGYGNGAINARHFEALLMNPHHRERPGLPVLLLDGGGDTAASISQHYGSSEIYARQIRALGQQEDVLVIFTATGNPQSLVNAVQAAHERNMRVLCLGGQERGHLSQLLGSEDMEIGVPAPTELLVHELHLLMTVMLCELIDDHLFGGVP